MNVYVMSIAVASAAVTVVLLTVARHPRSAPSGETPVLSQLLRYHPSLIALTDSEGQIQDTSKSFERMFSLAGRRVGDRIEIDQIIASKSAHDYHSILHYVLREKKPLFDFRVVSVAGDTEVALDLTVLPVLNGIGEARTLIHLFNSPPEDSENGNGEGEFDDASGIGMIAAGIAHELNTPLGSIILSADIIQDAEIPPHVLEEAAKIKHQAEHCSDVVRGVLIYAKRDRYDRAKHDMAALVKTVCRHIENEAKTRGTTLRVETTRRAAMVMCNESQIQQVCYNLLSNALYAVDHGGEIHVTVHRDTSRGEITVGFEDNGRGIPRDDLRKIFDPFYTTKPSSEGTGLGLALCQKTVSEHGGRLEVNSEVGVGTKFTAHFPEAK